MTIEKLQQLKQMDTSKIGDYLFTELRGITNNIYFGAYCVSYVIVKSANTPNADISSAEAFFKSCDIYEGICELVAEVLYNGWDIVQRAKGMFDIDMYTAFLLCSNFSDSNNTFETTPNCLSELAIEILQIKPNDKVMDYFCGVGSFIRECIFQEPNAKYYGVELNWERHIISIMRADIFKVDTCIYLENVLKFNADNENYSKIFANYPFGVKVSSTENTNALMYLNKQLPISKKNVSLDWLANTTIINTLAPDGKAVVITTTGSLFNTSEKDIRKHFIDNNFIEAIINLPIGIMENTRVSAVMIVLSHNNDTIRYIDARYICTKGRRYSTFSHENIKEILDLYNNDGENSRIVHKIELLENDYNLDPNRYIVKELKPIPDGVAFENVIKNITRGAQLKATQLDKLASKEPTDFKYLTLSNIQNGQISDNLSYITGIDDSFRKYCIKNNNLILSKSGSPIKAAIATVENNETILANGNLYVIELDEEKINPYFLKAFLDSETGTTLLTSLGIGSVIPNLPIDSIKKMIIPLPSMEIQNKVANNYLKAVNELKEIKLKLSAAEMNVKSIYDEFI